MIGFHFKANGARLALADSLRKFGANKFALLRKFSKDERGVSAVEFALLLPVLILIYAGVADVSRGVDANRKVNRVSSVVGDLVSRQISVLPTQLDDVFIIGSTIMVPSLTAPQIRISFLRVEKVNNSNTLIVRLDWSRTTSKFHEKGTVQEQEARRVYLPEKLRQEPMNYIRVETQYTYTPLLSFLLPNIDMEETYFISPRYSDTIPCPQC
ncbi:pilus assembly protein [Pseudochrobactrum algeriensis]|uniref:TadE/TadG family type IV pilus assembly protein n=1 Tax=Pseudochrobactrum algeriensis TaxID=2834768 RepID=UPI001BCB674E|nr:TadE/TadG family type IV pilus assembly protein [Pseudochrobactrum algeriensis]MBX8813835.1 pilus assembly protein [Ochrobactrum sp. MR34]QVQ36889.1 pilus assembly protein [Pseudochrobactrum algeriensis]QVQ44028.1 pilus assembly protein [Pseudochrobactrum algeriensis]